MFPLSEESDAIVPLPSLKFQTAAKPSGVAAVTSAVAVPLTVPFDAMIVVVPGVDALNNPSWVTLPTVVLLLDHDIETVMGLPNWS